jgi:hypothetical protein
LFASPDWRRAGPIGHKPTYSASFCASIGHHNTLKIRTLVAHCTYPARLSQCCLQNWIDGFGLDLDRVKTLAVSFAAEGAGPHAGAHPEDDDDGQHGGHNHHGVHAAQLVAAAAPSTGIVVYATPNFPPNQYHVPGTPNPLNLPPMPSPGPGFVPVPAGLVPPGVPLASSPAPGAAPRPPQPTTAVPPFFQTVIPPALVFPPAPVGAPPHHYPVPLPMHALPLQLVPMGLAPAPPAAVVAAASAARLERRREERRRAVAAAEREVAAMCARVGPWLARASRREVERWCVVKNTDLRAGRWLLHVAPSSRKRSGLRYWNTVMIWGKNAGDGEHFAGNLLLC